MGTTRLAAGQENGIALKSESSDMDCRLVGDTRSTDLESGLNEWAERERERACKRSSLLADNQTRVTTGPFMVGGRKLRCKRLCSRMLIGVGCKSLTIEC